MSPRIGAVLVNYETVSACRRLAEQLREVCYEVAVVDNSAPSPTLEAWAADTDGVAYVDSGGNRGYTGGNNVGLEHLSNECECYLIVNPDVTIPDVESIETMAKELVDDPTLGIIAPRIAGLPPERQHSDIFSIRLLHWLHRIPVLEDRDDRLVSRTQVIGCMMLLSKDMVNEIGDLDTDFFMYNDEIEYCYRARQNGYQVAYDPECSVERGDAIGEVLPPYKVYYTVRNTFHIARKLFDGVDSLIVVSGVLNTLQGVVYHFSVPRLRAWIEGLIDGVAGRTGRVRYLE